MLTSEQDDLDCLCLWSIQEGKVTRDNQLEKMLTCRQVADFLNVSICTVRRWDKNRMLKSYRVGQRGDRRYRREDVGRFLERSGSDPRTGDRSMRRRGDIPI